ncbi:UNKNOWN [Stylonychia lemnae]|uniref:Uncharacterized protein n=1 Tax=Stylonychia lemnae TaxID=5949 RepID=A0A077ZTZ5_STYLE|nr:UNKNOWN [Stylonychia lemnae]|eukprot:CDW73368.1 UNKNOWN [Stylonychia lemnae]
MKSVRETLKSQLIILIMVHSSDIKNILRRREEAQRLENLDTEDNSNDDQAAQVPQKTDKNQLNWQKIVDMLYSSKLQMDMLNDMSKCAVNKLDPQYQEKMIEYNINQDLMNKQQAIDHAQSILSLDSCIDRVSQQIQLIQEQQKLDKQEFDYLMFLRRKYLIIDIRKDPYLGKSFAKQPVGLLQQKHYVITLNFKSFMKPKCKAAQKQISNHYLTKNQELMRRVIVQVTKNNHISLHFHPKIKEKQLLYLKLTINVKNIEEKEQSLENKLFEYSEQTYYFDFSDVEKTEKIDRDADQLSRGSSKNKLKIEQLDKQLKLGIRSLMLYDLFYKAIQEKDFNLNSYPINIDIDQDKYLVCTKLYLMNVMKIKVKMEFSDLKFEEALNQDCQDDAHIHLNKSAMRQLILNLAENTHTASVIRNLYFILVKKYLSNLFSTVFENICGFRDIFISTRYNTYEDISWDISKLKQRPEVQPRSREQDNQAGMMLINQINYNLTCFLNPRITIYMNQRFQLTVKEDELEGLRNTDTDAEQIQFINFFFTKKPLNSYSELIRIARQLKDLTEDVFQ